VAFKLTIKIKIILALEKEGEKGTLLAGIQDFLRQSSILLG
jgi:hypothetical protein